MEEIPSANAATGLLAGHDAEERGLAQDMFSCLDDGEKQALQAILLKIADSLGNEPDDVDGPAHGRGGRGFGKGPGKGRGGRR